MKWLEIVELRAVDGNNGLISNLINYLLLENEKANATKIYVNVRIETDWSIHVQNQSEKINQRGSEFALQLTEALKEFGLVNHNILIEKKI